MNKVKWRMIKGRYLEEETGEYFGWNKSGTEKKQNKKQGASERRGGKRMNCIYEEGERRKIVEMSEKEERIKETESGLRKSKDENVRMFACVKEKKREKWYKFTE